MINVFGAVEYKSFGHRNELIKKLKKEFEQIKYHVDGNFIMYESKVLMDKLI